MGVETVGLDGDNIVLIVGWVVIGAALLYLYLDER